MLNSNLKIFGFAVAFCILLSGCQDQHSLMKSYGLGPKYEIKADLADWKMVGEKTDPGGYFKLYQPRHTTSGQEKILINYGKNITTSLNDSMQEVIRVEKKLPCATFNYKVLSQNSNNLSFMTRLSDCSQGPGSLVTIRKVFNADDGQYSITYSAVPTAINTNRLDAMEHVIVTSHLQ